MDIHIHGKPPCIAVMKLILCRDWVKCSALHVKMSIKNFI